MLSCSFSDGFMGYPSELSEHRHSHILGRWFKGHESLTSISIMLWHQYQLPIPDIRLLGMFSITALTLTPFTPFSHGFPHSKLTKLTSCIAKAGISCPTYTWANNPDCRASMASMAWQGRHSETAGRWKFNSTSSILVSQVVRTM